MPELQSPIAPPSSPSAETQAGESTSPVVDGDSDTPAQVGRFHLLWELARGGMGVVYRAIDPDLNRVVAVKLVRGANDAAANLRFVEEARVTAQLQHPGIPPVYEAGELPDGRPYLAMKLIKGRTLADLLTDRTDLSVDRPRFVAAFESIAQAIGYAHSQGVIHRDLKPQNVMVGAFGEVQVMDWGLARTAERQEQKHTTATAYTDAAAFNTVVGSVVGTPAYCAPEQARGELDAVGERSDVFGLGAVLCAILTGRPPFDAPDGNTALVRAVAGDTAEACARLDSCGADVELIALCKRCLSADPADRPADGKEVADEVARLRAAADERAKEAEVEAAKAATRTAAQKIRHRLMLAAVVVLMAIGLVAGWQWVRAEGEGERAKVEQKKAEEEQKKAEGEQRKAEDALGQVKVEQGKTNAALDAKTEQQQKTAAALAEVQAGRRRSLAALRELTGQVAVNPFRSRGPMAALAVRAKVADLWDEFTADDEQELATEAAIWAAGLRWDAAKPADTLTAVGASLKRCDALPAVTSTELKKAAAFGAGYVGFARTEGGRTTDADTGAPDEYRTAVSRLRDLATGQPKNAEWTQRLAEALATVAHHDKTRRPREASAAARESLAIYRTRAEQVQDGNARLDLNEAYRLLFDVWGRSPLLWPADAGTLLRDHLADEVGAADPKGPGARLVGGVGRARKRLGGWLRLHGKYADAEKEFAASIAEFESALKTMPLNAGLRLDLCSALTDLGECQWAAGNAKGAIATHTRCDDELKKLPARGVYVNLDLERADGLAHLAAAHAAAGDAKAARATAADCRKLFDPFPPTTVNYAQTAPRVLGRLALAEITLRLANKDLSAVPLLVEKFDAELAKQKGPLSSAQESAQLRWELAKCLMKAGDPAAAVKQLSAVCEAGFTNRDRLAGEFAPLNGRDDFKKLHRQLPDPKK